MNRREALQSLTALAGATGISVTPVTTREATDITLMIIRCEGPISHDACERLRTSWEAACVGTRLEGVKTLILTDGLNVEFVRSRV